MFYYMVSLFLFISVFDSFTFLFICLFLYLSSLTKKSLRQNILSCLHPLTINSNIIKEIQNYSLGVIIDNNLSWTPHVNALCKKIKAIQQTSSHMTGNNGDF